MILKNKYLWYLNFIFMTYSASHIQAKSAMLEMQHRSISRFNDPSAIFDTTKADYLESLVALIDTEDQLLAALDSQKPTAILLFMNNCTYCKTITPIFQKHALEPRFKKVNFLQANGYDLKAHTHVKRESKDQFKIPGYPSVLFVNKGKIVDVLIGGDPTKLEQKLNSFT